MIGLRKTAIVTGEAFKRARKMGFSDEDFSALAKAIR